MGDHLRFHDLDLGGEGADDSGQGTHDRGVGTPSQGRLAKLGSPQRGLEVRGALVGVAPPGAGQRATDAGR